jgi:hypothetical protein
VIALKSIINQAWWHMSIVPAHRRLRKEDLKIKDQLSYIIKPCLKKN